MTAFRRRLSRTFATTVVILMSLSAGAGMSEAQSCMQGNTTWASGWTGTVAADGVIEFTFRVQPAGSPGSLSDMIHYAILEAAERWNQVSNHTNIRFVPVTYGATSGGDLVFELDNTITDPCAQIDANGVVGVRQDLWNIAGEHGYGYEWAVATIAHEFGHFVRLADTGGDWSTIMGSPGGATCSEMRDNWQAGNGPTTVHPWLGWSAQQCFDEFRETYWDHGFPHHESAYYESELQSCGYWVFEWWDYWWCINGECQYWYSTWFYLGCF